MEKEEEILNEYIRKSGEATNKLQGAIGSLSAKRSKDLTESIIGLRSTITHEIQGLMVNNTYNTEQLHRRLGEHINGLNSCIRQQVENLIESNKRLSKSNERYSKSMKYLTVALVLLACYKSAPL